MSGRKCGNCRHYEPAPIWRSGWCRNPRLYGPQESHLVRQEELACAHRIGNYWEPVEDDEADGAGERSGFAGGLVRPLRLFGPGPRQLATASGPSGSGRFGSGGGGAGDSGGGSGPLSSSGSGRDIYGGSGAGGRPPQEGLGGAGRPDGPGRLPGQERSVSYQPEERYWTDYLRIALPVVGLLLMLGLFWFWAANLIGDDDDDEPPAEIAATNTVSTETPTTVAGGADTPPAESPPPADTPPAETPPSSGGFAPDTLVEVIDEGVRFRTEPRVADDTFIRELSIGEELTVVSGPQDTEGNTWYEVRDASGQVGWVAADFIQPI